MPVHLSKDVIIRDIVKRLKKLSNTLEGQTRLSALTAQIDEHVKKLPGTLLPEHGMNLHGMNLKTLFTNMYWLLTTLVTHTYYCPSETGY